MSVTQNPFDLKITPDGMMASIRLTKGSNPVGIRAEDVAVVLKAAEVVVTDDVTRRIDEYMLQLATPDLAHQAFTIAVGEPPVEGTDGVLEWDEALDPKAKEPDEDARVDYYAISAFVLVEEDAVIGRLVPPVPSQPGYDVYRKEVQPTSTPHEVQVKANVVLAEDGQTVRAARAGRVIYKDLVLSIVDVLEISENVCFATGNVDAPIDVCVRGTIQDRFVVKTTESLAVGDTIEAAEVWAGKDVVVRGGILNRNRGSVRAGGDLVAKFCDEARLTVEGDVKIAKQCLNSVIYCNSRLLVEQGVIIGGDIYARCGVQAKTIGSDAGVPTLVAVGNPPESCHATDGGPHDANAVSGGAG